MSTNLSVQQASTPEVYDLYPLRDWIEHPYKPAKHELGWADFQMRKERAIVRHWQLVMLAFTFSLLEGVEPEEEIGGTDRERTEESGGKSGRRIVWNDTLKAHQELAMPVGAHDPLLAKLVHCTSSNRVGSPA